MVPATATRTSHRLATVYSRLIEGRVISNVRWTFAGNSLYALSQWMMVVVLARYTNPQTVGTLALALAITAPVIILFNMQLRAVIATDVTGHYDFQQYFQTRVLTTISAVALMLPRAAPVSHERVNRLGHHPDRTLKSGRISQRHHPRLLATDRTHGARRQVPQPIRAFLTLGTFTLAIATTRSLIWGSAAFLSGSIGVFLAYDLPQVRRVLLSHGHPVRSMATLFGLGAVGQRTALALVRLALPLGIAAMLISLNSAIPRYFVNLYSGKRDLGIFSALSYFIVVGNLLTNAVGQSVLPRLARAYKLGTRTQFNHLLTGLLACSMLVAIGSMTVALLFGRRLLLIYGREYADAYPVFLLIMAAASIAYSLSILNFSLNAIGAYRVQIPIFVAVTLVLLFTSSGRGAGPWHRRRSNRTARVLRYPRRSLRRGSNSARESPHPSVQCVVLWSLPSPPVSAWPSPAAPSGPSRPLPPFPDRLRPLDSTSQSWPSPSHLPLPARTGS